MKRLILLLLPLALSGCFKGEPPTVVPGVDRVYTVDEFVAQPVLRKKVSAVCSNDPGRTGLDPNCVNVRRADHIASVGTTIPSIVP
jgi:hypothetical protein